jgi:hypothetical protein
VLVLTAGAAPALAASSDDSSTRSYIQANYSLVQYAAVRLGTAEALLQGVLNKVRADCPAAAGGSPQNPESTMLSYEIIGAMVIATYHAALPEITAFIRVAARSQWSNRALTRTVRSYAANLRTLSRLAPPDLCRDIRAWTASGYKTLSPRTVEFDRLFIPAWVAIGLLPPQLRPFERSDERGLLQRSGQLEEKLGNFEAEAVETYAKLMNALGVLP